MSQRMMKICAVAAAAAFLFSTSAMADDKGEWFKKMDSNGDSQISSSEHETSAMEKFTKADANRDNLLTKGELAGFMIDEKGKSGKKAEKKSDKKMTMFDTNNDGQLTQQEYQTGSRDHFAKMDSNTDGSISMDEMKKAKDKM